MRLTANKLAVNPDASVLYVDMNSFFASCEQQLRPELRGRPIGVCAGDNYYAVIIAPSNEAKKMGVKTGMRLTEIRDICPDLVAVPARPVIYRQAHIGIMQVLRRYSEDVLAKSIDEAAMNLSSYRYVYKDLRDLALRIKQDLLPVVGECVTCSIGIAPNTFLAKLATDLEKPNGLVEIRPDNIDGVLQNLKLTDLPGIAGRNARRLQLCGISNPLEMRHASPMLLRKVFGGVAGHYWHSRLNFGEVDFHQNDYRSMSATRTTSPEFRTPEKLDAMLISLCTKLEQRLVKGEVFAWTGSFFLQYTNGTGWEAPLRFADALQDGLELRRYILCAMRDFETRHRCVLLNSGVKQLGISLFRFQPWDQLQYSLFDDRIKQDRLRRVLYGIKDKYGKYSVRKATEMVEQSNMRDAIGFGSVKDLTSVRGDQKVNHYLLQETDE